MLDSVYGFEVPSELQGIAMRHQQHLADLVAQLQSAGMEEGLIERSVDQLIASYRGELLEAVKRMGEIGRA